MSVNSWLEEFYLVDGKVPDFESMSDEEALQHAIRKYEGTKRENLNKHDVQILEMAIEPFQRKESDKEEIFIFSGDNCSLCKISEKKRNNDPESQNEFLLKNALGLGICGYCPIVRYKLHRIEHEQYKLNFPSESIPNYPYLFHTCTYEFGEFLAERNPDIKSEPMIETLQKTLTFIKREKQQGG